VTAPRCPDTQALLAAACARVGLDATGAAPIRLGENAILRLPSKVVARISRPGQADAAAREVAVARWLGGHGVRAVEPIGVPQPVEIDGRAVTFWHELPRTGTAPRPPSPPRCAPCTTCPSRPDPLFRRWTRSPASPSASTRRRP
jgi:hypothetical protein